MQQVGSYLEIAFPPLPTQTDVSRPELRPSSTRPWSGQPAFTQRAARSHDKTVSYAGPDRPCSHGYSAVHEAWGGVRRSDDGLLSSTARHLMAAGCDHGRRSAHAPSGERTETDETTPLCRCLVTGTRWRLSRLYNRHAIADRYTRARQTQHQSECCYVCGHARLYVLTSVRVYVLACAHARLRLPFRMFICLSVQLCS